LKKNVDEKFGYISAIVYFCITKKKLTHNYTLKKQARGSREKMGG